MRFILAAALLLCGVLPIEAKRADEMRREALAPRALVHFSSSGIAKIRFIQFRLLVLKDSAGKTYGRLPWLGFERPIEPLFSFMEGQEKSPFQRRMGRRLGPQADKLLRWAVELPLLTEIDVPLRDLSKRFGLSQGHISKLLKFLQLPIKHQFVAGRVPGSKEFWEWLEAGNDPGTMTQMALAAKFHISQATERKNILHFNRRREAYRASTLRAA